MLTLFAVAVLFVAQQAHYLAAVQVIVYAGAIVVLFLFVIMLLGVDRTEDIRSEPLVAQRPLAFVVSMLVLLEALLLARTTWSAGAPSIVGPASGPGSNIQKIAGALFTRYLLAFEVTSVLLVIAVVGAVVLARRVTYARMLDDIGGQVVVFFVLVVAAAEVVVGLAIIIIVAIFRIRADATADDISLLRG